MIRTLITACLLLLAPLLYSQNTGETAIKKMSIEALKAYIDKSDKPLVVNFWATFCKPCVEEIPYFQKITSRYAAQKVELILVSLDLPEYYPKKIADFAQRQGFKASIMWLNETNADIFCPVIDPSWSGSIPATLFINKKSGRRRFHEGELTPAVFEKELKKLIE